MSWRLHNSQVPWSYKAFQFSHSSGWLWTEISICSPSCYNFSILLSDPCKQTPFHQVVLIMCGNLHIFVSARQRGIWDTSDDGDLLSTDLGWLSGRRGLVGIWKSAIWGPFNILPLWIPTCHSKDSDTTCLSGTSLSWTKCSHRWPLPPIRKEIRALAHSFPQLFPLPIQDFPSLPGSWAKKISQILYNLSSIP